MWLAEGDFYIPVPGGISGIVIAGIFALATVVVALLRRRKSEQLETEAVRAAVAPAVDAAADVATRAVALQLVALGTRYDALATELNKANELLDLAYQQGFVPPVPAARPHPGQGAPGE